MAGSKIFHQERRMSLFYVIATAMLFVALFLITLWVISSPSEPQERQFVPVDMKPRSVVNTEKENQSSKELQGENKEKTDELLDGKGDAGDLENKLTENDTKQDEEVKQLIDPEIEETQEKGADMQEKGAEMQDTQEGPLVDDGISKQEPQADENAGAQSEIQIENQETTGDWTTQASKSREEKEKVEKQNEEISSDKRQKHEQSNGGVKGDYVDDYGGETGFQYEWTICQFDGAADYIPCLDNKEAVKVLPTTSHYEHRERHCPDPAPTCLVPVPEGYRSPIPWPQSRNEIWYSNVPHPGLVSYKKDQNWVKKSGERLVFPGGGTQFKKGALHYIDFIEQTFPDIMWGNHTRVILDVGCGVASFGGYLFDKELLTMSFAPKDEHEAQVQLALERGIPAISSVMGTQRLVFPSNVYDAVHCARCRVPWHIEGGKLLLEVNRVLRPGGFFFWSATPIYWIDEEDVGIWKEMVALTAAMCWDLVAKTRDSSTGVGLAIFRKPKTNFCYENRKKQFPPLCDKNDKPDAAWYVPMTACIHKVPSSEEAHGADWPQEWPLRLTTAPVWLNSTKGLYGKPAAADFVSDTEHWQRVVDNSYVSGLGIEWKTIRNVMDMKAVYGGFAAALASQPVWVMNVVQFDAADTLPIIFDRGLFGIYHDWCESFSSYPRTYDLLHADHLFKKLKRRCSIKSVVVEMDRLLRPQGWVILREKVYIIKEIQPLVKSLRWRIQVMYEKEDEGLLAVQKSGWRPKPTS